MSTPRAFRPRQPRHCQSCDVTDSDGKPSKLIHPYPMKTNINPLSPKAWRAMPHTLALATLSLYILGAGSQKADAKQPAAPVLTRITSRSPTSVTLTWTVSDTRPGWLRVFYGTSSGNLASQADFDKVRSGTITGLTTGTRYFFAVRFFVSGTTLSSALSNELSFRVTHRKTHPPLPR
jgi:hypothetical protein